MRKLTRKSLEELAKTLPIVEKEHLTSFVGGGTGSVNDPFTFWEYKDLGQLFTSGWVDLPESTSYLTHDYYTYYGGSNYDGTSEYDSSSDYSGGNNGFENTDSYTGISFSPYVEINSLISQLPSQLKEKISNTNIYYDPSLNSEGQYDPFLNVIYLKTLDYNTLYRECIHYVQQTENYCGTNHAAKEFQEHVIGDIYQHYMFENGLSGIPQDTTEYIASNNANTNSWGGWLYNCVTDSGVNLNVFLSGINNFISIFQTSHSNTPNYQGEIPSNYNFNWQEMFQIMGIPTY